MNYKSDEYEDGRIDIELSELCADSATSAECFDPFGSEESMWINGGKVETEF